MFAQLALRRAPRRARSGTPDVCCPGVNCVRATRAAGPGAYRRARSDAAAPRHRGSTTRARHAAGGAAAVPPDDDVATRPKMAMPRAARCAVEHVSKRDIRSADE